MQNDKGGKDQGVNVLGAKQLGGEWFGVRRPGFCYNKMPVFLLGSTVDKDELELNSEPDLYCPQTGDFITICYCLKTSL